MIARVLVEGVPARQSASKGMSTARLPYCSSDDAVNKPRVSTVEPCIMGGWQMPSGLLLDSQYRDT